MNMQTTFPPALAGRWADFIRAVQTFDKADLADATEFLIMTLDALDGDADLEPEEDVCIAGDDGCGPRISPYSGGVLWGSDREEDSVFSFPVYAIDQSRGPVSRPWGTFQ
jgi:hypothetical protein